MMRRPLRGQFSALGVLVGASYMGVTVLEPGLPQNLAFIDPVIALICLLGLVSMTKTGSPAIVCGKRAMPYIFIILLGSVIGLIGVGLPLWAISNLSRLVFALVTFFFMWHILWTRGLERIAYQATSVIIVFTTFILVVSTHTSRGRGLFPHANYAGHFIVLAATVLIAFQPKVKGKLFYLVVAAAGLFWTASFGAIAMATVMTLVAVSRSLNRAQAILLSGLLLLLLLVLVLFDLGSSLGLNGDDVEVSSTISAQRFERSQGGRLELWSLGLSSFANRPYGVGPDGAANSGITHVAADFTGGSCEGCGLRIHNEYLAYLVERGPIGLIGLLGFWAIIWRMTQPGGVAHLIIVGIATGGLFRETMHYRHLWLLLALAIVLDRRRRDTAISLKGVTEDRLKNRVPQCDESK